MVSKTDRFRGSRTHGRGMKRGRGAGLRGGRGNAGLHKHKYSYTVKYMPDHFGRHGFKRPQSKVGTAITINVGDLEEQLAFFAKDGNASEEKGVFTVDLEKLGIDKLLGRGTLTKNVRVKVKQASARAVEKVESAGGKVKLTGNDQ